MSPGNRVFIVDDEECVRKALARLFRSVGLAVETFPSAQAFLERKVPDHSACLLLDVCMPGLSGPQLLEALELSHVELPIVFMTGHIELEDGGEGSCHTLHKPFGETEVLDFVRQALAGEAQPIEAQSIEAQ